MSKSIVISERDNIAAVVESGKVAEFFIHRGDMLLGDVYLAFVENILPSIDAAFVNLGGDKMGFLHASDVAGKGALKDRLKPKQTLLVQIIKEPTGHKGPRVTTAISLPGRFLVLMPDEKGINVSRKIVSAKERARLKSVVNLIKPAGVGVIVRTEAEGQAESEIQEDLELLLEKWNNIVSTADTVTPPNILHRDQDLLYRVIREACTEDVKEIVVDTSFALHRTNQLLQSWNMGSGITVTSHKGTDSILTAKGIDREIRLALQTKANLPSGGYLYIQSTEALTVIDVNSGKFTSSATQSETIRKTNLEAVAEIARQLRLRNIGGMIIIDFIDMESRVDQLAILEELELAIEPDKSKPQVGQLSDLGLVELTRHRQGQSLMEIFTKKCPACSGAGAIIEEFNFALPPQEGDFKLKPQQKMKVPQKIIPKGRSNHFNNGQNNNFSNNNAQNSNNQNNNAQKPAANVAQSLNKTWNKPLLQVKKIDTAPSLVASMAKKIKMEEKIEAEFAELTDDKIKQHFSAKGFIPNLSKATRFSAVPPGVAREHMNENYVMNVFSILQELESNEQAVNEAIETVNNVQQQTLFMDNSSYPVDKAQPENAENMQQEEQPAQEIIPENSSEIFESKKVESAPKKIASRGRKPGAVSRSRTQTKRRPPSKPAVKPSSENEQE